MPFTGNARGLRFGRDSRDSTPVRSGIRTERNACRSSRDLLTHRRDSAGSRADARRESADSSATIAVVTSRSSTRLRCAISIRNIASARDQARCGPSVRPCSSSTAESNPVPASARLPGRRRGGRDRVRACALRLGQALQIRAQLRRDLRRACEQVVHGSSRRASNRAAAAHRQPSPVPAPPSPWSDGCTNARAVLAAGSSGSADLGVSSGRLSAIGAAYTEGFESGAYASTRTLAHQRGVGPSRPQRARARSQFATCASAPSIAASSAPPRR